MHSWRFLFPFFPGHMDCSRLSLIIPASFQHLPLTSSGRCPRTLRTAKTIRTLPFWLDGIHTVCTIAPGRHATRTMGLSMVTKRVAPALSWRVYTVKDQMPRETFCERWGRDSSKRPTVEIYRCSQELGVPSLTFDILTSFKRHVH